MKKLLLIGAVTLGLITMTACEETSSSADTDSTQTGADEQMDVLNNSVGVEMRRTESIQKHLTETQPQPQIEYSLERANIIERTERWNDENKTSYIYLISEMGTIMSYHTVKGKVSSVNSMLSTPQQIVKDPNMWTRSNGGGSGSSLVVDSPQEDGSYGENGDGIFFFTTEGVYVEWNGKYMLTDEPMNLTQEPVLVETTN